MTLPAKTDTALLGELRQLIEQARQHVAQTANSTLTMLYWRMGARIQREVLKDGRAGYGEQIVTTLSTQLVREYGQGFGLRSLRRLIQFAEAFPDEPIVATLSRQLSWSHFVEILPLKKPLEREFYAEMCRMGRWRVRTLCERIGGAATTCANNARLKMPHHIKQPSDAAGLVHPQGSQSRSI